MSNIQDLTIPNPDFKVGEIIDSEKFDANNIAIRTKINEAVAILNPADDRATANEAEIVTIKGAGWVDETIKKNADDLNGLAGTGRTTETVKANADGVASGVVAHNAHVANLSNPHNVTRAQLDVYSTSEIDAISQSIGEGQLQNQIGTLSNLTTTAQDNLVNAINEVDAKPTSSEAFESYKPSDFAVNQKLVDLYNDPISEYTGFGGTLSLNKATNLLGNQSVRIDLPTGAGAVAQIIRNNVNFDLTKLEDGRGSTDDDYIFILYFVDDVAVLQSPQIFFQFSQASTFSLTDIKQLAVNTSSLVTGWNFLKLKKSTATTIGSGSWSGIQSYRVNVNVNANAGTNYMEMQLIQLVKKHPALDQPHYFQLNDESVATVNSGEWYVGLENGSYEWKELNGSTSDLNALNFVQTNTPNFKLRFANKSRNAQSTNGVVWYKDDNNYITASISSDLFVLVVTEGGVQDVKSTSLPIDSGDVVSFSIDVNDTNVNATASKNGDVPIPLSNTTTLTGSGTIAIRSKGGGTLDDVVYFGITTVEYADRAGNAFVANRLVEQPKCRVRTSGSQLITNGVPLAITWASDDFEYGFFNIESPTQIEIQESGYYDIDVNAQISSNLSNSRACSILVNGSTVKANNRPTTPTLDTVIPVTLLDYWLDSGDIVTVTVYQDSGVNLNLLSIAPYSTVCSITRR